MDQFEPVLHFTSEVRETRYVDDVHTRLLLEVDEQTWGFDAAIAAQHPEEPEEPEVGISIHVPIRLRWLRATWLSVREEIRSHLKSRHITTIRPILNIANRRTALTIVLRPFEIEFSCSTGQVDQMRCSPCAFRPRSPHNFSPPRLAFLGFGPLHGIHRSFLRPPTCYPAHVV